MKSNPNLSKKAGSRVPAAELGTSGTYSATVLAHTACVDVE